MDAATAVSASAAVLLVIAGMVKVVRPAATVELIEDIGASSLGPFSGGQLALGLGAVEIVVGVAALVLDRAVIALAVGALYLGFTATVLRAMQLGAASCGCFGRIDAPPSWFHVIGNAVLAAVSFVAAAGRSPLEVMADQPAAGLGFVAIVGVLAGIELVVFTALPQAVEARRAG